ncbi:class I SAM-dependent DNA methyltransferase [Roseovarius sp. D22-M7]|uniref:class I SAM-dependent DNA methyltransferase n=1 Tax=Roseovarius sp. D22-M7 TaxID=3127116 RepID=UPI003010418E
MSATQDIVAKLWKLCAVLRDDGVTYSEYVTELTFLLFLKMMAETGQERRIPEEYRWDTLAKREGLDQLTHYKHLLTSLGDPDERDAEGKPKAAKDPLVLAIFENAQTRLRKPANLKSLTTAIEDLDWFDAREEGLGDLYEGLLQKNAEDKKSGAGQYFTPRPLIDSIIRLTKPQLGERIQDPAAGTGGFIVAAHRRIYEDNNELYGLPEGAAERQIRDCYSIAELVPDTHRLCLMNIMLHGIEGDAQSMDTLTDEGAHLPKADLILSNPPFGNKKGGGRPQRSDFSTTVGTSNKQLAFVEHMIRGLKPGGRAAVVVPDNVLFEDGTGRALRQMLMNWCDLHTILRLPTGIFYAQGVKTNVILFTRNADRSESGGTQAVWVYDMRAGAPSYGKTRPLRAEDFADFEAAFGDDPHGRAERQDQGEEGRFRRFTREEIAVRGDNLDISWLRDGEEEAEDGLTDPDDITAAILGHLREATREIEALVLELEGEEEDLTPAAVAAE